MPDTIDPGYRDPDRSPSFAAMLDSLDYFNEAPYVRRARRVLQHVLRPRPGNRILDVGCGPGLDVAQLAPLTQPGGAVIGVDVSRRMLALAEQRWPQVPGAEFRYGRLEALDLPDSTFDAAFAMRTVQYLSDPLAGVRELARVTRVGGRVVLVEGGMSAIGVPDSALTRYAFTGRGTSPGAGSQLPGLLRRVGLVRIGVRPAFAAELGHADPRVLDYASSMAANAVAEGLADESESKQWLEELERQSEAGQWFSAECLFVAFGMVSRRS